MEDEVADRARIGLQPKPPDRSESPFVGHAEGLDGLDAPLPGQSQHDHDLGQRAAVLTAGREPQGAVRWRHRRADRLAAATLCDVCRLWPGSGLLRRWFAPAGRSRGRRPNTGPRPSRKLMQADRRDHGHYGCLHLQSLLLTPAGSERRHRSQGHLNAAACAFSCSGR